MRPEARPSILFATGLDARYGKNRVLRDVSLSVGEGEVVALIGPNAAGKTTALRTLMGLKTPHSGQVVFRGRDITRTATAERVRQGLVLVPEGRQLFAEFSVYENLVMGAYLREDRNDLAKDLDRVFALFPRLRERRDQRSGSMSGGEQQMVAIGRGLISRPQCLLLDEPTLGLAPIVIEEIEQALHNLSEDGLTILISEQNATMALSVANRAYVLESGAITMTGDTDDLRDSPEIKKQYLGV